MLVYSWSTDGRELAIGNRVIGGFIPGIVVFSIPDRKLEKLTDFGLFPIWLSDNRRLLFIGSSRDKLYILDTQSRKSHEIFAVGPQSFSDGLAISPDNRTLYYSLVTLEADLWLISLR